MISRVEKTILAVALAAMFAAGCATGRSFARGEEAGKAGDWEAAVSFYCQALQDDPDRPDYKIALERAMVAAASMYTERANQFEDAGQLAGLMAELVEWLNSGDLGSPVLVRAAMAHLNLVSIHPWRDGNGRMSRCLHTLVLARDKVLAPEFSSIEEWLGESTNTYAYYEVLRHTRSTWDPVRNAHAWVRFCLRAHHMQAQLVQRRIDRAARTWHELTEIASSAGLDERVISALYAAATGQLRRTTYQHDESLTRDQAIPDIRALRRLGLVQPTGHGRSQQYVAAGLAREHALKVVNELRRTPLHDPYG